MPKGLREAFDNISLSGRMSENSQENIGRKKRKNTNGKIRLQDFKI